MESQKYLSEYWYDIDVFCLFQKRQLAVDSGEFNLKDKIFIELFPDVANVSLYQQIKFLQIKDV